MLRILVTLLSLSLTLIACVPASAESLVQVSIIDRDAGRELPRYPHAGEQWIAGAPGHRYSIRLTNTSAQRVLAVLSVDGVNAVSGQTAHPDQGGYVLAPWESTEIHGWRKSLDDVAQFVFTDLGDSYAARTGRPRNVGVIGVAVFREQPAHRPAYPHGYSAPSDSEGRRNASKAESSAMAERVQDTQQMGTGHGQREWSPVSTTEFRRASRQPQQISQIRYDDAQRLVTLGILPRRPAYPPYRNASPQAFPQGFVADPPDAH